MAHPTRREVLIGGAALFAVAATGQSDLTAPLNALPFQGNQGEFLMSTITTQDLPRLPSRHDDHSCRRDQRGPAELH
jgi:hypothetical protein